MRLPATLIFDHPTPAALCQHVADLIHYRDGGQSAGSAPQIMPPSAVEAAFSEAARRLIGVRAAVHRLPGSRDSDSVLQSAAADSATVLPLTRWEVDAPGSIADSKVSRGVFSTASRGRSEVCHVLT